MKNRDDRRADEAGFSAIEAVLVMALLASATLSMGHTVVSGQRCLNYIETDTRIIDQAQTLMARLTQIPFGAGNETAASSSALNMLVSIENDLFGAATASNAHSLTNVHQNFTGATVTLTQVKLASPMSWQYAVNGNAYYGLGGTWQIFVDRDLNGDGDLTDPMEVATATSQDLFRVEIRYDGRRILHTIRSRNPSE